MEDELLKALSTDGSLLLVALRSTQCVKRAQEIHQSLPTATAALGRVISGALLLSAPLKGPPQKVSLQLQGRGPLREVFAEADWQARTRGYVKRPLIHLGLKDGKLDVGRAIGEGTLSVLKDLGLREPYFGSTPLRTGEVATDLAYYLAVSEQVPSAVSLGVHVNADNSVGAAGGFMVQALAGAPGATVAQVEEALRSAPACSAMVLQGLSPQEMLEQALGGRVAFQVLERRRPRYHCPCGRQRVLDALASLGRAELQELLGRRQPTEVTCKFCQRHYVIEKEELQRLLEELST
jgi:molecular chaperone Hsp33